MNTIERAIIGGLMANGDNRRDYFESPEAFRNGLIFGFILSIIWAVSARFISAGWGMAVVNIGFLIVTVIATWVPSLRFLKLRMPTWAAFAVATVIYFLIFVVVRSVILELLAPVSA